MSRSREQQERIRECFLVSSSQRCCDKKTDGEICSFNETHRAAAPEKRIEEKQKNYFFFAIINKKHTARTRFRFTSHTPLRPSPPSLGSVPIVVQIKGVSGAWELEMRLFQGSTSDRGAELFFPKHVSAFLTPATKLVSINKGFQMECRSFLLENTCKNL